MCLMLTQKLGRWSWRGVCLARTRKCAPQATSLSIVIPVSRSGRFDRLAFDDAWFVICIESHIFRKFIDRFSKLYPPLPMRTYFLSPLILGLFFVSIVSFNVSAQWGAAELSQGRQSLKGTAVGRYVFFAGGRDASAASDV